MSTSRESILWGPDAVAYDPRVFDLFITADLAPYCVDRPCMTLAAARAGHRHGLLRHKAARRWWGALIRDCPADYDFVDLYNFYVTNDYDDGVAYVLPLVPPQHVLTRELLPVLETNENQALVDAVVRAVIAELVPIRHVLEEWRGLAGRQCSLFARHLLELQPRVLGIVAFSRVSNYMLQRVLPTSVLQENAHTLVLRAALALTANRRHTVSILIRERGVLLSVQEAADVLQHMTLVNNCNTEAAQALLDTTHGLAANHVNWSGCNLASRLTLWLILHMQWTDALDTRQMRLRIHHSHYVRMALDFMYVVLGGRDLVVEDDTRLSEQHLRLAVCIRRIRTIHKCMAGSMGRVLLDQAHLTFRVLLQQQDPTNKEWWDRVSDSVTELSLRPA